MAKTKAVLKSIPPELQRDWGWLLSLGILFVILGTFGLGMIVSLTLVSMFFLGALLIIAGISQVADTFKCKHWEGALWHVFIAILYIIGGSLIIYDPFLASTLITGLLAMTLIVIGVSRLFMAFNLKNSAGWGWLLVGGLSAIVLGTLILAQWPVSGLWVMGLFIAIEMIIGGWTYIFLALAIRRSSPIKERRPH